MKALVLGFILAQAAQAAQIRTLFYNEGSFRLKCQISDKSNRCSKELLQKFSKDLCKSKGLELKSMGPIVCIDDLDTSKEFCKFANGECAKAKKDKEKEPSSPDKNPEYTF